ncbi:flagellar biosynthesis protein FlhB [Tepidanaerobacter sp. EBM-38]|uniref:flagellar biosynthesis protein FlhB n=1 Tax=Tepidanaerobacter sp. EBM-38 TaxID=1918496 RepID=UPI000A7D0969|nr:flagellar biosynthesis protein FlhB [Tepidanaerobacter sp. EBM-38]
MNLQLFAEERTEKATPRRRQKARERGQVFSSRELNSALVLLGGFLLLKIVGKNLVINIMDLFNHILTETINKEDIFTLEGIKMFSYEILIFAGKNFAPIALGLSSICLISNYMQVGFVLSFEPISPKLERINPLEGFKRIFSRRSLLELIKSVTKIIVVAYVVYTAINRYKDLFPLMLDMNLLDSSSLTLSIAFEVGIKASITLLIISAFDYFYQWYEYETSLMMSKQDIKEEYKEVEGNPQIKSRVRQIQRQMARGRMMKDVEKADVVITNPTHYAVALAYDATLHSAPVVLAKGVDKLAEKIKEIATREDVPIVENKALAQTLYKTVEIGDIIPESLYNAVAEILAFIYSLKERRP